MSAARNHALVQRYREVRARSLELAGSLTAEDQQVQAFEYASPTKWHLGHTTWFFETFVLSEVEPGHDAFDPSFAVLFNSYYEGVGERFPRASRGLLSRPPLGRVHRYRAAIDDRVVRWLEGQEYDARPDVLERIVLGLHHEEQHQELLLTDILANLSVNPLRPAWREETPEPSADPGAARWIEQGGGLVEVGHDGDGFHFDNEAPRHKAHLDRYLLRSTLVTNAEVLAFIEDGGYQKPSLWLSDGIAWVRAHDVIAPRYWRRDADGRWLAFSLYGEHPVDPHAPVTHISGYEADAIATWLGGRLPTEREWEWAAANSGCDPAGARAIGRGQVRPVSAPRSRDGWSGLFGETWQWTRSAYEPYPGFRPHPGAIGEYNGKFMANQWVLRGGSCATAPGHARVTYRNFFYLDQRWQFTGLRLAR